MNRISRTLLPLWIAVVSALLGWGCNSEQLAPDVIARIGEREVRYEDFEVYLKDNSVDVTQTVGSDVLSALLDSFLREEVVRELAVERRLGSSESTRRSAAQAMLAAEPEAAVTEAQVEAYFRQHSEEFKVSEQVELWQILTAKREQIDRALADLEQGIPFEEVARRYSEEPNAPSGGLQGWLAQEDLPPAIGGAIFSLGEEETSGVIEAEYGFHIFRVTRRRPEGQLALAEVEAEIRRQLQREASQAALEALEETAISRYNMRVFERNLPFNYLGQFVPRKVQ